MDENAKRIVDVYETGKHRRYALMFAVNGGAFAIAKLMAGEGGEGRILGGLELWMLALGMAIFTGAMTYDIWKFGERMRVHDPGLFAPAGQRVLLLVGGLIAAGWLLAGFGPGNVADRSPDAEIGGNAGPG